MLSLVVRFDATAMRDLRPLAVAGSWYPAAAAHLAEAVDAHLAAASVGDMRRGPLALVVPHAGLVYSGPVAAYAYKLLRSASYASVVLVGPSHFVGFHGTSIWPRGAWETPFGRVPVDDRLAAAIAGESPDVIDHPAAHAREHSLEMQLPFVAHLLPNVPIVPLVMGYQTRDTAFGLGDALARALSRDSRDKGRVLLVASSDLSHFEDAAVAARLDDVVLRHVEALDADGLMQALERDPRHACGGGPMVAVLRAAARLGATRARVLRHGDSGDVSGDKSSVVGYMSAAIW